MEYRSKAMEDYRRVNSEAFMYFIEPPARAHYINNSTLYQQPYKVQSQNNHNKQNR